MTLVHREIDRLADGSTGMMQIGRRIGEFDEIVEILNRAIASALVDIGHKGRAIGGRENRIVSADHDRSRRIAGMLHEFARCRFLDDGADEAVREDDPLPVNLRSRCLE